MRAALSKILVIDDEVGPRESLRILLKNDYHVFCVDSVEQGLILLKEEVPEVVVLDIRMPRIGGIEALRRIREIDMQVSVIMLTGFGALETAQEALRLGANDYLRKPFDINEIRQVILHNCNRTRLAKKRAQMVQELKDLNDQLIDKMAEKERLAVLGQASKELVHDLNTPLSVILGYAQLLSKKLEGSEDAPKGRLQEALDFLGVIEKNVKRCTELAEVWQSLGVKNPNRMKSILVSEIIQDVVQGAEPLIAPIQATIKVETDSKEYKVFGDNIQIFRALQNIVTNAIHALPSSHGVIRIRCYRKETNVEINIEDNGCGMNSDQFKHMFDPYYTTKEVGKGTGLGLFITKRIIEDHKGSIQVQSEVGKGTAITIQLPLFGIHIISCTPRSVPSIQSEDEKNIVSEAVH